MDFDSPQCSLQGSESQDSDELLPPGTTESENIKLKMQPMKIPSAASSPTMAHSLTTLKISSKGVENAKKRLRAFSIQKKTPIATAITKPASSGSNCNTVLIGKLTSVKTTPKPEKTEEDVMKMPKPPKPGALRKGFQESYTEMRKKTLAEIETMKRKMELVELGIPLGLICPATNDKAMPTKAMPPIRSFLDDAKLDEIIREAKRAKAEGKEFKFDYRKFVPDYENPFQRKKEDPSEKKEADVKSEERVSMQSREREKDRDKRSDKHKIRKKEAFMEYSKRMDRLKERAEGKSSHRSRERDHKRDKDDKSKERDEKHKAKGERSNERDTKTKEKEESKSTGEKSLEKTDKIKDKNVKETNVDLNDYLVCDSWSLDNDDRTSNSPQVSENSLKIPLPKDYIRKPIDSPKPRLERLMDSFKYELDDNDDALDIFDEDTDLDKYTKSDVLGNSPVLKFDYTRDIEDLSKESADDTFLESVIAEIKQECMSDDEGNHDKSLVEYDISPDKEKEMTGSVTPELEPQGRDVPSQRSDYSDGYRSVDSRKSSESGYKSTESFKNYKGDSSRERDFSLSMERELDEDLSNKMSKSTHDSLELWSFVIKICQPLLFRHDKNKCFKETRSLPHVWYSVKPRACSCVKDRKVVYAELEACKMTHVDALYSTADDISTSPVPTSCMWYPPAQGDPTFLLSGSASAPAVTPSVTSAETTTESTSVTPAVTSAETSAVTARRSMTPERGDEVLLDREYQKFMAAVEAAPKKEQSRSTTPVKQKEERKKKKAEDDEEKKAKKVKLNEDWSEESEVEEDLVRRIEKKEKLEKQTKSDKVEKSDKVDKLDKEEKKKEKIRKRKQTTSISDSEDSKRKKKAPKNKDKKVKARSAKRRRLERRMLKKLKDKKKMKENDSEMDEEYHKETRKKEKKLKKKKQQKLKKKAAKKKTESSSSDSSTSSSSSSSETSESEIERKTKKAKRKEEQSRKKKKEKRKKRKKSTSESSPAEDLFDLNVLNNIKTERLTDDETKTLSCKKHQEIINVKELQDDFTSSVKVKVEAEEKAAAEAQALADRGRQELDPDDEPSAEAAEEATAIGAEPVNEEPPPQPPPPQQPHPQPEGNSQHAAPAKVPSPHDNDDNDNKEETYFHHDPSQYKEEEGKEFEYEHEQGNYEMYEQLAMAYQSDVASQRISPVSNWVGEDQTQRIETVVCARGRGEIKCDWRAGDSTMDACVPQHRPSRWGLKPVEVNIVLTGGESQPSEPVYMIQSLANRQPASNGYDEAYMDTYGAADKLQYGDCFGDAAPAQAAARGKGRGGNRGSLDDRIDKVLQDSVRGDVTKGNKENDGKDKENMFAKSGRVVKRVSFADGYKPGQDSDVEEPPVKKKRRRRVGCPWPCPATHLDHVPLWDALPPPPPPPGSPPPPALPPHHPPLHLLRQGRQPHLGGHLVPPPLGIKFDPASLQNFMPPEPPPGLITFN